MTSEAKVRPILLLPFDVAGSHIGGIRTFAEGFVSRAPEDFDPIVVAAADDPQLATARWTTASLGGREVRSLPIVAARGRLPVALRFAWQLLRQRGQLPTQGTIVQIHRPGTDLPLVGSHRPRVRFVHNLASDLVSRGSESRWRLLPGALARLEAATLRRMDLVYAVGDRASDQVRLRYPTLAQRVRTITNWYDERMFRPPVADERIRMRAELGLDQNADVVVYAGRLERQKNPLLLAESFAVLARQRPRAQLLVIGEGALRHQLEERLVALDVMGSVKLLGGVKRQRVAELLRSADVFCISSEFETGPTVGMEALGSGVPVVITPVGQVAQIVASAPGAGIVVEPTPAGLAAGMDLILAMPLEKRRAASTASVAALTATRILEPIYEDHRRLVHASSVAS